MSLDYSLEAGFVKKDSKFGSRFGFSDFKVGSLPLQNQINLLLEEITKKYTNISSNRRYKIRDEMANFTPIKYMNHKYLAASINIVDQHEEIQDENPDLSVEEYTSQVLNNPEKFKFYLDNVMSQSTEKIPDYQYLVKTTIFTYVYKLYNFRNPSS
jgi:hypothetical protein